MCSDCSRVSLACVTRSCMCRLGFYVWKVISIHACRWTRGKRLFFKTYRKYPIYRLLELGFERINEM